MEEEDALSIDSNFEEKKLKKIEKQEQGDEDKNNVLNAKANIPTGIKKNMNKEYFINKF